MGQPLASHPYLPLSTLSQERPSACLRPLAGKEAASGPASARSRAFPGHMLQPWPSTGRRAGLSGGRAGWGCGLSVHTAQPCQRPPRGPSPGPLHSSAGPARCPRGLAVRAAGWRSLISSWPAGSGRPREQRVDCASFWACSPPGRCPRGALGVMFVFVAKRESSGQAARAQRTNGLRYQPQAQEPRSRQPVLDPAGLPPSPPWPPEAPRRQPGSSVPALRLVLCRHLPSPAHGMRLSSPRPARHPLAL